jgi:hypothetical protein
VIASVFLHPIHPNSLLAIHMITLMPYMSALRFQLLQVPTRIVYLKKSFVVEREAKKGIEIIFGSPLTSRVKLGARDVLERVGNVRMSILRRMVMFRNLGGRLLSSASIRILLWFVLYGFSLQENT